MPETVIFIVLLVMIALLALWRGGAPEKFTSAVMIAGTTATALANASDPLSFRSVEWQVFWIDLAMLGAFVGIALYADRFWPLWVAALQCIAVAAHAARAFDAAILPIAYWWILGKLAYPMILVLGIGVQRHQHRTRVGSAPANGNHKAGSMDGAGCDLADTDEHRSCERR